MKLIALGHLLLRTVPASLQAASDGNPQSSMVGRDVCQEDLTKIFSKDKVKTADSPYGKLCTLRPDTSSLNQLQVIIDSEGHARLEFATCPSKHPLNLSIGKCPESWLLRHVPPTRSSPGKCMILDPMKLVNMNVVTKLDTRKPYATRADSFVGVPSRLRNARDEDHNEADGSFPSPLRSGLTPELDHDLSAVRGGSTENSPVIGSERKMNKHDSSLKRVFPKRVKDKEHIKESISEPSFENEHAVSEDDKKHNSIQKCLTRWRKCKKLRHSQKSTETPSDPASVTSEYLTVDPSSPDACISVFVYLEYFLRCRVEQYKKKLGHPQTLSAEETSVVFLEYFCSWALFVS